MENLTPELVLLNIALLIVSIGLNFLSSFRLKKLEHVIQKDSEIFKYTFGKQREAEEKILEAMLNAETLCTEVELLVDEGRSEKRNYKKMIEKIILSSHFMTLVTDNY